MPVSFFFSFICKPYPGLWNCKSVFLILKILQYDGSRRWAQLFPKYPFKNWYKNWYLHFYKTCKEQIWQAGTSTGVKSNETIHAGAGDVTTSRSCDKLKTHLHYHSIYAHQTWQGGNLPWWAPPHKVIWPFGHVVLYDHVTNQSHYIFTTTVSIATKLGRMVTQLDGLLLIKLHDSLITWSYRIMWQTKNIISPLLQCLRPPNLAV